MRSLREIKYAALTIILFGVGAQINASEKHNYQQWHTYFGGLQFNEKWSAPYDVQIRLRDGISDKGQILARLGAQYAINKKASVLLGYAYITSYADLTDTYFPEHRIFQQFTYKTPVNKWDMVHRARLEQRLIGTKATSMSGQSETMDWQYRNRFRYFNRSTIRIKEGSFYVALQEELFFNLWRKTSSGARFDQNRLLLAVGHEIRPQLRVDMGYMNQFVLSAVGSKIINHAIQFSVYHQIYL